MILFCTLPASGALVVEFQQPFAIAAPSEVVEFRGALSNVGANPLYINGTWFVISPSDISIDDSPIFLSVPQFLDAGDLYSGILFYATLSPTAATEYVGSFSLLGGLDPFSSDEIASADFSISVQPVPEPSYMGLVANLVLLSFVARRATKTG
jgi:hypothetical protein